MKNFNKSTLAAAVGTAALALAVSGPVQAESSWSLSGWVNQGLTYADDGNNTDIVAYPDNGNTLGSRLTFAGSTDLPNSGLNAGFEVILEPRQALGFGSGGIASVSARDNQVFDAITVLGHSVHVGGAWGKVTIGQQSMPTDNIAVLADPSLTLWSSISPVFRGNGILVQNSGGSGAAFGDFMGCLTAPQLQGGVGIGLDCNGIYRDGVRYDLPTFIENLNIAVGYANDDVYDVAAKYNTQLGRIKTIIHLGYAENNGPVAGALAPNLNVGNPGALFYDSADNFQAQLGLMDPQTGLFGTFAYQSESADLTAAGTAIGYEDDTDAYWLKVGVKRKFNSLGDTSFAFQYGSYNDQYGALSAVGVTGSEVQRLGLEVNQYFGDKLIMYGVWENLDVEVDGASAFARAVDGGDELDTFTLGLTYFF